MTRQNRSVHSAPRRSPGRNLLRSGALALVASLVLSLTSFAGAAQAERSEGVVGGAVHAHPSPPEGDFYRYPSEKKLRKTSPGDILATEHMDVTPALRRVSKRTERIMYRSTGRDRRPVAVTGFLMVPRGKAPHGGWPLVAWNHGTSGVGPDCAPSRYPNIYPDTDFGEYAQLVAKLLAQGYAVVGTDYHGLGFPGMLHDYLNLELASRAVNDGVRAARQVVHSLSRKWFAVGHSQGGHATLGALEKAHRRAPRPHLLGGVAIAPVSHFAELIDSAAALKPPLSQDEIVLAAYMLYAAVGAHLADPRIRYGDLLSPELEAQIPAAKRLCLVPLILHLSALDPPLRSLVRPDWRRSEALRRYVAAQEPGTRRAAAPLLLLQGGKDAEIPAEVTDRLNERLCAVGDVVKYKKFPDADHISVLTESFPTLSSWLKDRLHHRRAPNTCGKRW